MCNELVEHAIPMLDEDGFFEADEGWNEDTIKKWVKDSVKTTWRARIINLIYTICEAEDLNNTRDSLPTTDSINLEVHLLKNTIRELQIASKADIEEKRFLASELSKVQQDALTAAFIEEERKIRVELMDAKMWKDDQQNPLIDAAKKAPIISLLQEWYGNEAAGKVDIFVACENAHFAAWIKLTFPTMHEKFNFETRLKVYRQEKKAQ